MDEEKKYLYYENVLCAACLCVDKKIEDILDNKLKEYYINILNELPFLISIKDLKLCWECKATLKKIIAFREQVKDCHRILQTYTYENLSECLFSDVLRTSRLTICSQEQCTISHADPILCDNDKQGNPRNDSSFKSEEIMLAEEAVKEDNSDVDNKEDYTDIDNLFTSDDIAKLEVDVKEVLFANKIEHDKKNGKKNARSKFKKSKNVKDNRDKKITKLKKDKSNGHIKTIELTYKEMYEERLKDTTKDTYVNAEYKCDNCLIGFSNFNLYNEHVSKKHSPDLGEYSCPVCNTILATTEAFTSHYKKHIRRFECIACGIRSMDKKSLLQHYEIIHKDKLKEYKCDICGKLSYTIDSHRYHKGTHKKRVECQDCDKTFSHRAGLMNHRLTVHKGNNGFPCTICNKKFIWKTSLKKHMEKHEKEKPLHEQPHCEPCGVTFTSICSLQRHMRNSLKHVTENELRYICNDCGRKFANKTKLRDHIEEKHLNKAYQCHICHKASKNRVCLDQHIRNVHKGRPKNKICHHCGKGFPTKVQLESHIRSHTGEKPFICEHCPTTFSQQSNLYKHNRQVHMNIKGKRYPICRKRKIDKSMVAPIQMISVFPISCTLPNKEPPPLVYLSEKEYII